MKKLLFASIITLFAVLGVSAAVSCGSSSISKAADGAVLSAALPAVTGFNSELTDGRDANGAGNDWELIARRSDGQWQFCNSLRSAGGMRCLTSRIPALLTLLLCRLTANDSPHGGLCRNINQYPPQLEWTVSALAVRAGPYAVGIAA